MSRRNAPEELPEHLRSIPASREDVRIPWTRDGWFWGPVCPQNKEHGALIDLKGTDRWYCRHQGHIGSGVYSEDGLIDLEWNRLTAGESSLQKSQPQSEEPETQSPDQPQY